MEKGITEANKGLQGLSWKVVGQTYVPKLLSHDTFVWAATMPAETSVPPHIHPTQDEWIVMIQGNLEIEFTGDVHKAGPGDTVRMQRVKPMEFSIDQARKQNAYLAWRQLANSLICSSCWMALRILKS